MATLSAKALLTPDELLQVRERSDVKALLCVAHAWGLIFAAMALFVLWPNPLTFLAAVLIIGARQLGLAVLMHDASHGMLASNQSLNNFLGSWLCGDPIGSDLLAYRAYHLQHHANTQQPNDPDIGLSAPFPITKASFRRKMIRDLTGQTGFKQRRSQIKAALGKPEWPLSERWAHFKKRLGRTTLVNLALFAGLAALGYWYLYPLLWIIPLITWHMAITRVRNIAEHAVVPDSNDIMRQARTTKAGPITRFFIAPYWVNYHVEHHMFMWVPCYNLPKLHAILGAKGIHEKMEIQPNYRAVIDMATSKPDVLPEAA